MNQVRIHKFLQKTKKSKGSNKNLDEDDTPVMKEQDKLRKKVNFLMKKQKLHQVREIVKGQVDSKPWGQEGQAKVCTLLA